MKQKLQESVPVPVQVHNWLFCFLSEIILMKLIPAITLQDFEAQF